MRVCLYAAATHLGGAEKSLLDLARSLVKTKYQPLVLVPKAEGPLIDELKKHGVDYKILPIPKLFYQLSRNSPGVSTIKGILSLPGIPLYLIQVGRLLRKNNIKLIHTHGIKVHFLGALVAKAIGVPVIWHIRDILSEGFTKRLLNGVQQWTDPVVVANSKATAQAFTSAPVKIVYNGLDPEFYVNQPNTQLKTELKSDGDRLIIGILGVLARWKGHSDFVQMAKQLLDQGCDADFVIVGDEIYDTGSESGFKSELVDQVMDLGIQQRVHFLGFRKDTVNILNGLDILVHASKKPEPFGRVVVEAMACGVPVVASSAGGILEIVRDGKSGILFEPGNVSDLVSKVHTLAGKKSIREQLRISGRDEFLNKFTLSKHVNDVVRIYDDILR